MDCNFVMKLIEKHLHYTHKTIAWENYQKAAKMLAVYVYLSEKFSSLYLRELSYQKDAIVLVG